MNQGQASNVINWNLIADAPRKPYGWFVVATVPRGHAGEKEDGDIKGDNEWRKHFGFSKAWLNGGRWWEPSRHGTGSNDISSYVTHWAECPEVPELSSPHQAVKKGWGLYDRPSVKDIMKAMWEEVRMVNTYWDKANPINVTPEFEKGFLFAFKLLGLSNK